MLVIAITIYCISCCIKEPMECLSLLPNYFDVPQASVYLFYFQVSASLAEKIHDLRMNCSGWEHVYKITVYIYETSIHRGYSCRPYITHAGYCAYC